MTSMQAADYIFENLEDFRAKYAGVIAKFESKGIDPKLAEAMAITLAATAKAVSDYAKA